jgi:hypothetical protein
MSPTRDLFTMRVLLPCKNLSLPRHQGTLRCIEHSLLRPIHLEQTHMAKGSSPKANGSGQSQVKAMDCVNGWPPVNRLFSDIAQITSRDYRSANRPFTTAVIRLIRSSEGDAQW